MRRLLLALCLLLLGVAAGAQDFIRYYPPAGLPLTGGTMTGPLGLPAGTAGVPALSIYYTNTSSSVYGRTAVYADATYLHVAKQTAGGGAAPDYLYFEMPVRLGGDIAGSASDTYSLGSSSSGGNYFQYAWLKRGIVGSASTALADNTKKAFTIISVASESYGGGTIDYTLYCADAADRVTRSGVVPFAAQNTAGTESCTIGAATSSGDSSNNAKTFAAVTFTCADGGANAIQIEVQADCSIAAPTTLTIQTRPAQAKFNVVTPQT